MSLIFAHRLLGDPPATRISRRSIDPANMEARGAGIANSSLWAVATTAASNGSVNAMHDSFTPIGGMMAMMIQLGEIYGGVGSGLRLTADGHRRHVRGRPHARPHAGYLGKSGGEVKMACSPSSSCR
jgi:hypothetical protein